MKEEYKIIELGTNHYNQHAISKNIKAGYVRKHNLDSEYNIRCGNYLMLNLDLSKCPDLKELYCHNNRLTVLDLSNCSGLTHLTCYDNNLTSLDLSNITNLRDLFCDNIVDIKHLKHIKNIYIYI